MTIGGLVSIMVNKVYSLPTMFAWMSDWIVHRYSGTPAKCDWEEFECCSFATSFLALYS